jgi:pimeloyl-ACP methyl ester carboxylesterase
MYTFALIHGGGDVGWYWHRLAEELRSRGHETVAPDLPCDDDSASLDDYANVVIEAIGDRKNLVVVGQSYGGFTAALVAARLPVDVLVFVAGMIPAPGEAPSDWWGNTGYGQAVKEQAALDGGQTGHDDPFISFYNGVPRELAEEAVRRTEGRGESATVWSEPWPLDKLPDVPTKFILGTEDHFFPAPFFRRLAKERLGIVPDEIAGGHGVALSHPKELADLLTGYTT